MSIEVLQTVLFPIFLLLFWQLPKQAGYRLPLPFVGAAVVCWALSALNIRGYLPAYSFEDRIVLGALTGDAGEKQSRELSRRYNAIAEAYEMPKMKMLLRSFGDTEATLRWLAVNRNLSLLVSGSAQWLRVFFPAVHLELAGSVVSPQEFSPFLRQAAESWKIPLDDKVRVVRVPGTPGVVVLALVPESLGLPGEPGELSRHYLGWLAVGLGKLDHQPERYGSTDSPLGRSPGYEELRRQAFREDALAQTCQMLGAWHSPEPIALARLLAATYELAIAITEISPNAAPFFEASAMLNSAQKLLRTEQNPELISLIRSNTAVAWAFEISKEEEASRTRREFISVGNIADSDGRPTFGARLSMLNLMLLEEAGLL